MFKGRSKSLNISERDPVYKVKYLGNVLTAFMRGDGCVDRPASVIWNNYLGNPDVAMDMQLTVCVSGLKVRTKDTGMTEYRAHRISYCVCHPLYPRLFIWVYRHEGKKMKVELRCHAVLCRAEAVAMAIAVQLHDKLTFALTEFAREKVRRQRARLSLQRANSLPNGASSSSASSASSAAAAGGPPMRTKFLTVGQNFKPPSDQSTGAPKLGSISEDLEEKEEEEEEEEAGKYDKATRGRNAKETGKLKREVGGQADKDLRLQDASANHNGDDHFHSISTATSSSSSNTVLASDGTNTCHVINGELSDGIIDLEIGNDIETLLHDVTVQNELIRTDSDSDGSVESAFPD